MKTLLLPIFAFLLPLFALGGPITLLECVMEGAPIEQATVSSYGGRLFLITRPIDGNGSSRVLAQEEWEKRQLVVVDNSEMKGVLFLSEGNWLYTFKDQKGWRMKGDARCAEYP